LLLSASLRLLLTTFCHNNPHLTRTLLAPGRRSHLLRLAWSFLSPFRPLYTLRARKLDDKLDHN
jgi:hypothetical protein